MILILFTIQNLVASQKQFIFHQFHMLLHVIYHNMNNVIFVENVILFFSIIKLQ